MNWPRWNYIRIGFLALLQAVLTAILFYPWLQLAANYWDFTPEAIFAWTFLTAVITIFISWKSSGLGYQGLVFLGLGFLFSLTLAGLWSLPLFLCAPLTLILFLLGARFTDYFRWRNFAGDWGLASLLLVLTSLLQPHLGYDLSLDHVLFFFGAGIVALILWNATRLEREGLHPDYGGLGRSIPLFILGVLLLAGILGMVLSPQVLQKGIDILRTCYRGFAELLVLLVVRPFAWLMSPLFRWAERMETKELALIMPETEGQLAEPFEFDESVLSPEALQTITWASWLIVFAALFIGFWLVFKWALKKKDKEELIFVKETRESVFSRKEVLEELKQTLRKMIQPWHSRTKVHRYRGDDPLKRIRAAYARFVLKMGKKIVFRGEITPWEYYEDLALEGEEVNLEAVERLTLLYNEARYREKGDHKAASEAEAALQRIL